MTTISKQIIGGLALELDARLPNHKVILGSIHDEPAVMVDSFFVIIEQDKFKVVIPGEFHTHAGRGARRVLFECSIVRPDDDFEVLYEFFERYEDDFDTGPMPPLRENFPWTIARSAANSSK